MIFRDYGISTDEPVERTTSIVNYTYVMEKIMASSQNDEVRNVLQNTPALEDWHDRYYGVALQMITVFVEHLRGFQMSYREIFLMRHAFTFINYFVAAIFFYLILRRRFGENFISIVGALFFILYPRFFGESFFNIKDILFLSWCVISSYFILRWLEDDQKNRFIYPAAITLAIATNTRILGLSILLLACAFAVFEGVIKKNALKHNMKKCFMLILITFVAFVIITPFTWANPLKNTIDIFFHFLRFQPWDGTHFYLGEMITREVPWHYIPVWMGATVPILYIILFVIGFLSIIYIGIKKKVAHLYDLFFFALFTCTLFGFILLRISMYEGWRHAYSIYLPFLYIAVYGLYNAYNLYSKSGKITKNSFIGVVSAYLVYLFVWIIINHPYQYVYFNMVGRQFAERNFALDYWYVSNTDLVRYAINTSDEPVVSIAGTAGRRFASLLTEEESERVLFTTINTADFYIRGSRMDYDWRVREILPGFVELKVIRIDGMRIATLYERVLPFDIYVDYDVWDKIVGFYSNGNDNFQHLNDQNSTTRWTTGGPQLPGDYLMIEFDQAVTYNYIYVNQGRSRNDYPRDLAIYVSKDGDTWERALMQMTAIERHFVFESEEYSFLKLVIEGYSHIYWWSIANMQIGHAVMHE